MDKYDLYELTVQSPARLAAFLAAIHGAEPRVLAEDFCGTAALSRAWLERFPDARAIAVDHDPEPLDRARGRARIEVIEGDVRTATDARAHAADVVFAGNFSIGELATRGALLAYLAHARARLRAGGVLVFDTYGGATAHALGLLCRERYLAGGVRVRTTWEQRAADPATGRVENALHFRVDREGEVFLELTDAFVYRWRLWSLPELRDALTEAGFASIELYDALPPDLSSASGAGEGGAGSAPARTERLGSSYVTCVAARTVAGA